MTENPSDKPLIDTRLSEAYQHVRTEQPPASLDAAIRREARDALVAPRAPRWLLPLAYAATLTLAVSIVLEVQAPLAPAEDAIMQEEPAATPAALAAPAAAPEQALPAGKPAAPRTDRLSEEAAPRQRAQAAPAAAAPSAAAAKTASDMADDFAESRREIAADVHSTRSMANPVADSVADSVAEESASLAVAPARALASPPAEACPATARSTADGWLACIEALDAAGEHDRAEAERAAFRDAFPDPASLP